MKNIIGETPFGELSGRHLKSISFVSISDVQKKDLPLMPLTFSLKIKVTKDLIKIQL